MGYHQAFVALPTKRVGRPNPDLRKVLNTILYVEITGAAGVMCLSEINGLNVQQLTNGLAIWSERVP